MLKYGHQSTKYVSALNCRARAFRIVAHRAQFLILATAARPLMLKSAPLLFSVLCAIANIINHNNPGPLSPL